MKKLSKLLCLTLAITILASLTLTGCQEAGSKKLVVYAALNEDDMVAITKKFKEDTGIEIENIRGGAGDMSARVLAEKASPNADILVGGSVDVYEPLVKEGVLDKYDSPNNDKLDTRFNDPNGYWQGWYMGVLGLVINKDRFEKELKPKGLEYPKTWDDLLDERYDDVFVTSNPVTAGGGYIFTACQIFRLGEDKAWDYLTSFDNNIKNYYSSQTLQFQAIGRKEAAISFATQSAIVDAIGASGMPLEIVDATSGSPVITDGIAAINNAPHPNAAKAFVEFAGSAEMQAKLANEFNRIPTLKAAIANSPEWMQESYKAMNVDWSVISENESNWLQKFDTEIRDASKDKAE